ncbi:MAG: UDP-N-acetylenolpyruvoylglucosamine reductase [Bacteroidetes bacterium GWA2_30_7]|nr:MAG: UDP-N-acetylenolpyruvoylglucosamine reductase [Bacteroidetes bacterium GWA2_30_7]
MFIQKNFSLLNYNTFGINVNALEFFEYSELENLNELFKNNVFDSIFFVLGGGSNILFKDNFNGLIIHPQNKGIEIIEETSKNVLLKIAAGEEWDNVVEYAVNKGFYGIENLSFIPGNAGAAPIQNIGAYGVEIKEIIKYVDYFNIENGKIEQLSNSNCKFGYRDSIFKNELKNKIIVTNIYIHLSKIENYHIDYGNIKDELKNTKIINLKAVREAVINIRRNKLPDPAIIGNAGSFFKNPIVSKQLLKEIQSDFEDVPSFYVDLCSVKIPAGWLIEKCGFKGLKIGNAGVHDKQALVLVNYGKANANEIIELANEIISKIQNKFGIKLEPEVNII